MTTHLMVNGHIRCGDPAGHIAFGKWPLDLWVTSNPHKVTCTDCGVLGREGGLQPGPVLRSLAERAADYIRDNPGSPLNAVAMAIDEGVTVGELKQITAMAMEAS